MRWIHITALATWVGLMGCAPSATSPELQSARDVLGQARASEAARLAPADLRSAERLLDQAEAAPNGSATEVDLAYLAERHAMMAMANARQEATMRSVRAERSRYVDQLEAAVIERGGGARAEELGEVQEELSSVRRELEQRGDMLDARTRELREREEQLEEQERELLEAQARAEAAEERAEEAMSALQEFADVRREEGATIITLSGEVLFNYDRDELRPPARQRLGMVASVLRGQPDDYEIVVEGHTDSRGSDEYNMDLSQRRAESVRRFLVEQGVDEERIRAEGRGEEEPIASNDSPEDRANNRRVEIILRRPMEGERRSEMREEEEEQPSEARG